MKGWWILVLFLLAGCSDGFYIQQQAGACARACGPRGVERIEVLPKDKETDRPSVECTCRGAE